MLLRFSPFAMILLLSACSTGTPKHVAPAARTTPSVAYSDGKSKITPVRPIASSRNTCVDRFNFLRQSGDDKYQKYSKDYIEIGKGFSFLSENKDIMDADARRVFTNTLDMKLKTLCSDVNYAGFTLVQRKIHALSNI
ncbi:hypothetical protein EY507_00010 [Shigella sonnei]|jgi:hypothetical protein|nr:hypothetical protein [Shigella sonnei]EFX1674133.1 hypothetical protein [Shigella sonnei]EFX1743365.1 hypothetical protein [Shigella sonnei]EFX1756850.1 hypothetical protein [Shigella sonnei]